jgi:hypothetical protein
MGSTRLMLLSTRRLASKMRRKVFCHRRSSMQVGIIS